MTTPELLAEIDRTIDEYEASKVNTRPLTVLTPAQMRDAAWDAGEIEFDDDGALVPTSGAK